MATQMGTMTLKSSSEDGRRLTAEQRRAKDAWKCVSACQAGEMRQEYAKISKSIPVLIMNSGLMQVLAYCREKSGFKKKPHERKARELAYGKLLDDLAAWLGQCFGRDEKFQCGDFNALMKTLQEIENALLYQRVNAEVFAWFRWLRQLAAAVAE